MGFAVESKGKVVTIRMNPAIERIEENIGSRNMSDKIMWFSMWFLLTIVTFGAVGPFMIYYLIKRRNSHFERLAKLQELVLDPLGDVSSESGQSLHAHTSNSPEHKATVRLRNALAWALLSILIFPLIYILYFLTKDLQAHEESEHSFFVEILSRFPSFDTSLPGGTFEINRRPWIKYFLLVGVTLGFASVYWLYRIFNDYNYHFKMEWKIEDNLLSCLRNEYP